MKKFVLVISLFFLLTSCQAMTAPESTATPAPTNTIIPATATSTIEPIPTSVPPTLTTFPTLINIDFEMPVSFAPFENQFPLSIITQTNGYILRCAFDTAQLEYGSIMLSDGLEMRTWVKCYFRNPDNRIDYVSIPIYINRGKTSTQFFTLAGGLDDAASNTGFRGDGLKAMNKSILKIVTSTDKTKTLILGAGFGFQISSSDAKQNFMKPIIDGIDSEAITQFAINGDTSGLPKYGVVEHFLPAFDYLVDMFTK